MRARGLSMKNRFGMLWDGDAGVTTKKKRKMGFARIFEVIYIRVFLISFEGNGLW